MWDKRLVRVPYWSPLTRVVDVVVDIDAQTACDSGGVSVATPGEWQCKTGGVRRLAVANGPNIFQMLVVLSSYWTKDGK